MEKNFKTVQYILLALGPSEAGGVMREAGGAIEMPCCACMDRSCVRRSREVLLTLLVPALRLPY
jgi:hypothetical protein